MHEGATAADALRRFAGVVAEVGERAVPIFMVAYRAADADPQIAALVAELDRQRLVGAGYIADTVAERLGPTGAERRESIRDTIWTLNSPQLYELLVTRRGWPVERYRAWIETALIAQIVGE